MGSAYLWFESYLSDQQQCVSFPGHFWGTVSVGVATPGLNFESLLFSVFVNDLYTHSCELIYVSADNTELHHCGHMHDLSFVQHGFLCNLELDAIQVWLCVNQLLRIN